MTKFVIDYSISGSIEFEADTPEEAIEKFDRLSQRELAELGTLERLTDPMTENEALAELGRYYAKNFGEGSGVAYEQSGREVVADLER